MVGEQGAVARIEVPAERQFGGLEAGAVEQVIGVGAVVVADARARLAVFYYPFLGLDGAAEGAGQQVRVAERAAEAQILEFRDRVGPGQSERVLLGAEIRGRR